MSKSRYLLNKSSTCRRLSEELVSAITGITLENDAENAKLAIDFCVENFENPGVSRLWKSKEDVVGLFERIALKMKVHSEHERARRVMHCIEALADSVPTDEFVAITMVLHLISSPSSPWEEEEGGCTSPMAANIKSRMSFLKNSSVGEIGDSDSESSGGNLEQDWLDDTFSSSSSDITSDDELESCLAGDDMLEVVEPPEPVECSVTGDICVATAELDTPQVVEDYFHARCYDSLVAALGKRENISGREELVASERGTILHEAHVVRTMIMALHGNSNLGILVFDQDRYYVNTEAHFSLAHTSEMSLRSILGVVCDAATDAWRLRSYCERKKVTMLADDWLCNTVRGMLRYHMNAFTDIEKLVQQTGFCTKDGECTPTLIFVSKQLQPHFDQLCKVSELIARLAPVRSNPKLFMDCLHDAALREYMLWEGSPLKSNSEYPYVQLFLSALRPHVEIVSGLLSATNRLDDPFREFFIRETQDGELYVDPDLLPMFWEPIMTGMFLTAKSIRHIKQLGFTGAGEGAGILDNFIAECGSSKESDVMCFPKVSGEGFCWGSSANEVTYCQSEILLRQCLFRHVEAHCAKMESRVMEIVLEEYRVLDKLDAVRSIYFLVDETKMSLFLHDYFNAVDRDFQFKQEDTVIVLNDIVTKTLHLHTQTESYVCRIPSGVLTSSRDIHSLIPEGVEAMDDDDCSSQTEILSELLVNDLELDGGISVEFVESDGAATDTKSKPPSPHGVHALSGLRVTCRIESPLDVIVDDEALQIYQAIFNFLVRIKRTLYVVCQLHHLLRKAMLKSAKKNGSMHKISIMLVEHLHFVTNLHAYVMHRVVDISWAEYLESAKRASSPDELHKLHKCYLRKVCVQCMLSPEDVATKTQVMRAVDEILDCSIAFRAYCLAFLAQEDESTSTSEMLFARILTTHRRFARTNRFLLIMLTQRAAIGGVKHLEDVLIRLDFNHTYSKKAK